MAQQTLFANCEPVVDVSETVMWHDGSFSHLRNLADRLQQECDYINKMVSGANGFELPHNNSSGVFNTPDFLWESRSILPIYKKKQIACSYHQTSV